MQQIQKASKILSIHVVQIKSLKV